MFATLQHAFCTSTQTISWILMKKQNTMVVLWSENGLLLKMRAFGLFNWIQLDYNWTDKTADLLVQ